MTWAIAGTKPLKIHSHRMHLLSWRSWHNDNVNQTNKRTNRLRRENENERESPLSIRGQKQKAQNFNWIQCACCSSALNCLAANVQHILCLSVFQVCFKIPIYPLLSSNKLDSMARPTLSYRRIVVWKIFQIFSTQSKPTEQERGEKVWERKARHRTNRRTLSCQIGYLRCTRLAINVLFWEYFWVQCEHKIRRRQVRFICFFFIFFSFH